MNDAGWNGLGQINQQSRVDALRVARGFLSETCDRMLGGTSNVGIVSGTCYFQQAYLAAGDVISNGWIAIGAAPVGLTLGKLALWDVTTGSLLASTGNQSASWATTGLKAAPLTYAVPAGGVYYVGLIFVAGTLPSIAVATGIPAATRIGLTPGVGSKPILYGSQAGLSDIPSPLTIAAGAAPGVFWIGLS